MIYDFFSDPELDIKQGDIFRSLPHIRFDPEKLEIVRAPNEAELIVDWTEVDHEHPRQVVATVTSSYGIVVNQDCDTQHDPYIAFFEISDFFDVYRNPIKDPKKPLPTQQEIIQWFGKNFAEQFRIKGQKWFYLPPDPRIGFSKKMAVNFQNLFTVSTSFLKKHLKTLRVGRLNHDADEHFREHLSQYFRRYPYDEWYPLTKEEVEIYQQQPSRKNVHIKLKDYQK